MVDGGPPKTTSAEVEEMKVAKGKSDAKKKTAEIKAKKVAVQLMCMRLCVSFV
jgi:hypothetical protein